MSDDNDKGEIGASPTRIANLQLRYEANRAMVWVGVIGAALLTVYISQSLLVIFGAMVFAAMHACAGSISTQPAEVAISGSMKATVLRTARLRSVDVDPFPRKSTNDRLTFSSAILRVIA